MESELVQDYGGELDDSTKPDYKDIPMRVINSSARLKLSQLLNVQQPLTNSNNVARDYRGLAELMDFDYVEIRNFERLKDPTKEIIEAWESKTKSSVGSLLDILDNLGRYDVLDEVQPLVEDNIKTWMKRQLEVVDERISRETGVRSRPNQAPPIPPDCVDPLSVDDQEHVTNFYHAYVCYADCDIGFVQQLSDFLESPQNGFKLFIRDRDLAIGVLEYDAYFRLIEERCKHVFVILSPDFFESPECEFQAKFAAGLGIDQRTNKIIPIVYKQCSIPSMLSCLSKVDFSGPAINLRWNWEKIIKSLGGNVMISSISTEPVSQLAFNEFPNAIESNTQRYLEYTNHSSGSERVVISEPSSSSVTSSSGAADAVPLLKSKSSKKKWLKTAVCKMSSSFSTVILGKQSKPDEGNS